MVYLLFMTFVLQYAKYKHSYMSNIGYLIQAITNNLTFADIFCLPQSKNKQTI